ncbi:MAG TPA: peptide chain release factor N(5)-glutamine methyltransferase [Pyrinomonadaceae bacterium]|nr:peptide chain release factor N(5)-glutamine methyltransferase [Pyrinomonadaceae bacterium]
MNETIAGAILTAAQILRKAGVPESRREAGSLLGHVIERDQTFIITHAEDPVREDDLLKFRNTVERRAQGEPLQYITGHQEFFGLDFEVTPDVLIPRPETELLVEQALSLIEESDKLGVCDIGTGSGCIAIALAKRRPGIKVVATDLSEKALRVALRNAVRNGVSDRIIFLASDCFAAIKGSANFDLLVCNPPYVAADALAGLQREVREYEPRIALTPGDDGLTVIRRLLNESHGYLKLGGHLLMEIGFDQRARVAELVDAKVWELREIHKDLQGIHRIVDLGKL